MNSERAVYQNSMRTRCGGRVTAYYGGLARCAGGIKAALMLSQLLYWNGPGARGSGAPECGAQQRGRWIYKSVEELEQETGLTKYEQQSARKALVERGLVEARLIGIPRTWHYRVDVQRIDALMVSILAGHPEADNLPETEEPPPADSPGPQPEEIPLGGQPAHDGKQTLPTLGGSSAQLNNESKNTTEITKERAVRKEAPLAPENGPGSVQKPKDGSPSTDQSPLEPARRGGRSPDPRRAHPAVRLVKDVTGRYPPEIVFDRIIRALGDTPDAARFAEIHETWCARGYRPENMEGHLDWYQGGIPLKSTPPAGMGRVPGRLSQVHLLEETPRSPAELDALRMRLRAAREAGKQNNGTGGSQPWNEVA